MDTIHEHVIDGRSQKYHIYSLCNYANRHCVCACVLDTWNARMSVCQRNCWCVPQNTANELPKASVSDGVM